MHFWGAHEHDGVWHIAIAEASLRSYPFKFPTFLGENLSGYNYLLDFIVMIFSYFGFSSWDTFFRILPFLWFFFFAYVMHKFSRSNSHSLSYFPILLITTLFSSSFGFMIQLKNNGTIWGSSGIPTMQGPLSMVNQQFLWSLCFLILLWIMTSSRIRLYLVGVILFVLLGLKFYSVLPAGVILGLALFGEITRRSWKNAIYLTTSSILGLLLAYLFFYSSNTASGLVFSPMSLPKQIVEDPNMWHMPSLVQSWYTLKESGNIFSPRLWLHSMVIVLIFIIFNFGIRVIAFLSDVVQIFKNHSSIDAWGRLLVIIMSIIVPCLFVQKGDWWNTVQFLYYGIFFSSISLANFLNLVFIRSKKYFSIAIIIFALVSLPASIDILKIFVFDKSSYIPNYEIEILTKLRGMQEGVVMVQPFYGNGTGVLADTVDTAYVSAISGKQTYMADEIQMRLLSIDFIYRMNVLKTSPCSLVDEVDYVYVRQNHTHNLLGECIQSQNNFRLLESNAFVSLWGKN